ncbi:TonB-dependent receptor [Dasania marina]|uniref:TonB-dependent receptor n=1 Tax=Dasania marina TaxID=471499 RepID=UPI0030DA0FEB|tara:strand:- start:22892 stop:25237 length:2346 start_codon:yes stop_codon:yes gene_type:complete
MNKKLITLAIQGSILSGSFLNQLALANNDTGFKLEEVIVTSTRRSESVQDIPYNISAISEDFLEQNGITDLSKLTKSIPGVTYTDRGPRSSGSNSGIVMRGLNASRLSSNENINTAVSPVSTYMGETPLFVNLHLKDVERVEVLRGPQGTLYGSGSLGGTLRYIYNKPDTKMTNYEIGTRISKTKEAANLSHDSYVLANIALKDNLAIRTSAGHISRAGIIDAKGLYRLDPSSNDPLLSNSGDVQNSPAVTYNKDDIDDSETTYARVSLLWEPTDSTSFQFNYQMQRDRANGRRADNPDFENLGEYEQSIRLNEPLDRDVDLFSVEAEIDLGFATLSSSTSSFENSSDSIRDQTGIYTNFSFWSYYEGNPREIIRGTVETKEEAFVQELRLVSQSDSDLSWIAGVFYMDHDQEQFQQDFYEGYTQWSLNNSSNSASILTDLGYSANLKRSVKDTALFGELKYQLSDAWQVTVGARAFEQVFESGNLFTLPICGAGCAEDGLNAYGTNGGVEKETFRDEIFKFNTSYDISDASMIYFTAAEGFRRGGTNGIPLIGVYAESPDLLSYEPDKVTNLEVGFKSTFMDRFRVSSALFHITWDDIQIDGVSPSGAFPIAVNGGSAESKGLELELSGQITENLLVNLGYSYVDSALTKGFNVGGVFANKGDLLPGVSKHSASLSINYTHTINSTWEAIYTANYAYRDDVTSDINSASIDYAEIDGYSTLDISAGFKSDSWMLKAFIDNVRNDRAVSSTYPASRFGERYALEYVASPRTYGIGVSYLFD